MGDVLEKHNIRDSKRFFSEINRKAQDGLEVITYDSKPSQGEVSHIGTEILDRVFQAFRFDPQWVRDEELSVWTVTLSEVGIYGEGRDKSLAAEDLIDNILEYVELYYEDFRWFLSREETLSHLPYLRQVARCEGDRARIAEVLGVVNAA